MSRSSFVQSLSNASRRSKNNLLVGEQEKPNQWIEATHGMIDSIRFFSKKKNNLKAMMSMGDAWRSAFNDRVSRVHPQYKDICPKMGGRELLRSRSENI